MATIMGRLIRKDPAFKMACGGLPESGDDLGSQPTMSRLENAPGLRELIRISQGMVDLWCQSYPVPPKSITLDVDDSADTVHGHQQMSLWNAHGACPCEGGGWSAGRRVRITGAPAACAAR